MCLAGNSSEPIINSWEACRALPIVYFQPLSLGHVTKSPAACNPSPPPEKCTGGPEEWASTFEPRLGLGGSRSKAFRIDPQVTIRAMSVMPASHFCWEFFRPLGPVIFGGLQASNGNRSELPGSGARTTKTTLNKWFASAHTLDHLSEETSRPALRLINSNLIKCR